MHLAAKRGSPEPVGSPEDPNPEPFDQGTAEQAAVSASLADACAYNDELWAGVPPDVLWDPLRDQPPARFPPPSAKVPAKSIHPASSEASSGAPPTSGEGYVPGSLVEHYLTRRSRGSSKPPAPEEEIADPDEGLEEIIVDEVPPEFRERLPGVPPLRQPFRLRRRRGMRMGAISITPPLSTHRSMRVSSTRTA